MFINLSNHPSDKWSNAQIEAARKYGEIVDLPFPQVDPNGDEVYIAQLADQCIREANEISHGQSFTVHVMGEMTLTHALVCRFRSVGVPCVASTTQRKVTEQSDGTKTSEFQFIRFRNYI